MNRIITIGREFGSGGREVGKRTAELLQIPYYDSEIVRQIAQRTDLAEEYVRQIDEKGPFTYFPITVGRSFYPTVDPTAVQNMTVFAAQGEILKELAEKSDCVIVGRCANYVLREYTPLRVFIYAELDFKMQRCREKASQQEQLTDRQLKQHIAGIDRERAKYYEFVTGGKWTDKVNYDLCINTTTCSVRGAAQIVARLCDKMKTAKGATL